MKKIMMAVIVTVFLMFITNISYAMLVTIGTVEYYGSDYKLIWDDDNNGNSVVWLDYTHSSRLGFGTQFKHDIQY